MKWNGMEGKFGSGLKFAAVAGVARCGRGVYFRRGGGATASGRMEVGR
jgi:hypothetical protein